MCQRVIKTINVGMSVGGYMCSLIILSNYPDDDDDDVVSIEKR